MLWLVGLGDAADRHVGTFSLGMKQRLGLAAALLGDPQVLILDEPGNGLDPQGIRDLRELLRSRAANGSTVFVSSHLLAEVEHLADEVFVLNQGRLVASGSLAELQKSSIVVRTPEATPLTEVLEAAGATVRLQNRETLIVRGISIDEVGDRAHHARIPLHELSPQSGSLEELFLDWTGDAKPDAAPVTAKEVVR
jgi:ABC-2 type transport system ATP-binding protein